MRIKVVAYSGYSGEERPTGFLLYGHLHEIEEVTRSWYGEKGRYFSVRTRKGKNFTLCCLKPGGEWVLEEIGG